MMYGLHPASLLLVWVALATFVSRLAGLPSVLAVVTVLLAGFALARRRFVRLLRRARFLLASLVTVFGWASPGQYLFPPAGAFSPTYEGMHLALAHTSIIAMMLALVALLLEVLAPVELASACATLIGRLLPARGADERMLARLCLVMEYVEGPAVHWRDWLTQAATEDHGPPLMIPDYPWRRRDSLAAGVAVLAVAGSVLLN